jgi:predicted DNA binding CopG/RHH family protein
MSNKIKYLDKDEQELIESYNNIDVKKLKKPTKKEQESFKKAAKNFLKKETKMNIRIDPYELDKIKEYANNEGLKYQSFIKSIIHKYLTGQLVEKKYVTNKK